MSEEPTTPPAGTGTGTGTPGPTPAPAASSSGTFDFANFESTLTNEQKSGITKHFETETTGLKSALDTERTERGKLAKEVKALTKTAEEGSELKTQLEAIGERLNESERRTAFYTEASNAGCTNLNLAYLAAKDEGLFLQNGNPNMDAVKTAHPQLFQEPNTNSGGGAGGGTNRNASGVTNSGPNSTMNEAIRRTAGVARSQ